MSHPEFYNPASMALESGLVDPNATDDRRPGSIGSIFQAGKWPVRRPKSLQGAALARRPFHNYRITEPKRPYVKFGMTHGAAYQPVRFARLTHGTSGRPG